MCQSLPLWIRQERTAEVIKHYATDSTRSLKTPLRVEKMAEITGVYFWSFSDCILCFSFETGCTWLLQINVNSTQTLQSFCHTYTDKQKSIHDHMYRQRHVHMYIKWNPLLLWSPWNDKCQQKVVWWTRRINDYMNNIYHHIFPNIFHFHCCLCSEDLHWHYFCIWYCPLYHH